MSFWNNLTKSLSKKLYNLMLATWFSEVISLQHLRVFTILYFQPSEHCVVPMTNLISILCTYTYPCMYV